MMVVNNDSSFGALGGPKPQFSGLFVTPMRACGGEGGARAVTERPWFWSLGLRFRAWGWGIEWFRGRFVGS